MVCHVGAVQRLQRGNVERHRRPFEAVIDRTRRRLVPAVVIAFLGPDTLIQAIGAGAIGPCHAWEDRRVWLVPAVMRMRETETVPHFMNDGDKTIGPLRQISPGGILIIEPAVKLREPARRHLALTEQAVIAPKAGGLLQPSEVRGVGGKNLDELQVGEAVVESDSILEGTLLGSRPRSSWSGLVAKVIGNGAACGIPSVPAPDHRGDIDIAISGALYGL